MYFAFYIQLLATLKNGIPFLALLSLGGGRTNWARTVSKIFREHWGRDGHNNHGPEHLCYNLLKVDYKSYHPQAREPHWVGMMGLAFSTSRMLQIGKSCIVSENKTKQHIAVGWSESFPTNLACLPFYSLLLLTYWVIFQYNLLWPIWKCLCYWELGSWQLVTVCL